METIIPWAIWGAIVLVILSILFILGFGIVSLVRGKSRLLSIAIIGIPIVAFLVLGFLGISWAKAAIWTAIFMFVLGLLGLFLGGARGLVGAT